MITAARALAVLAALTLPLGACAYREIRPSIAEQAAAKEGAERFGSVYFEQIAQNVWQYTSYLDLPGFGAVPSNGLIVIRDRDALLVDTAWTDEQTKHILDYASSKLQRPITAAVLTHAHQDKMGGVGALHAMDVATYAHPLSNRIAPEKDLVPARHSLSFDDRGWTSGETADALSPLRIYYPGPGHTDDNITVAVNGTSIAFGGCLIKGSKAETLGNLAEADVDYYATSVANFAAAFPRAETIVMSHSDVDNRDAISRTLKLAKELN